MVQRGNCSWAVDTDEMAVDTVARGAVEATGMQIQFLGTQLNGCPICLTSAPGCNNYISTYTDKESCCCDDPMVNKLHVHI